MNYYKILTCVFFSSTFYMLNIQQLFCTTYITYFILDKTKEKQEAFDMTLNLYTNQNLIHN